MCCYDGVYLDNDEKEVIEALVSKYPSFFRFMKKSPIEIGSWGDFSGFKTSTIPYFYSQPEFPKHFNQTRCSLALEDGRCSLQVLAEELAIHPWTFKPNACWMHPLKIRGGDVVAPPRDCEDDDLASDKYPGYATYTHCGRHRCDGDDWEIVLRKEIDYFKLRSKQ